MNILEKIEQMVARRGAELYGGEAVTQAQHALQCAMLAERENASASLITAALLHDIGHLLEPGFEQAAQHKEDLYHEHIGCRFLASWFGEDVTVPVRFHVDAKRYLCAVDSGYFAKLSPASVHSLELQGGPFRHNEAENFIAQPFATDAVKLRYWDDLAKDVTAKTPSLEYFLYFVERALMPGRAA